MLQYCIVLCIKFFPKTVESIDKPSWTRLENLESFIDHYIFRQVALDTATSRLISTKAYDQVLAAAGKLTE